ncbi:MAG TPA: glyoxalase [Acidimicrobiia bacterium]
MKAREPAIDELVVGDTPEAWRAAGFTIDDDGVARVGTVRIRLAGREGGSRIRSWSLRGAGGGGEAVDGLVTAVGTAGPAAPAEHANGATVIDHLVVMTGDCDRTVAALRARGLEPRRERRDVTNYGEPMRQVFFRAGEVIVEVVGPNDGATDEPARFFGLAFTVADLGATAAFFGERLGDPKEAVQPGRQIAMLRHKQFDLSVAMVFMSPGAGAIR